MKTTVAARASMTYTIIIISFLVHCFDKKTKKVIHYNTKKHTYWHILLKNIHVTDFYPLHCFDVRIDRYWH